MDFHYHADPRTPPDQLVHRTCGAAPSEHSLTLWDISEAVGTHSALCVGQSQAQVAATAVGDYVYG